MNLQLKLQQNTRVQMPKYSECREKDGLALDVLDEDFWLQEGIEDIDGELETVGKK